MELSVLIFLILLQIVTGFGQYATSTYRLEALAQMSLKIESEFLAHHRPLEKKNQNFKELASMIRELNKVAKKDPKRFVEHPINAIKLIRLFVSGPEIMKKHPIRKLLKDYMNKPNHSTKPPTEEDLNQAYEALNRLLEVYRFDAGELARGEFTKNVKPFKKLEAHEMLQIAEYSLAKDEMYHAYAWANASKSLLESSPSQLVNDTKVYRVLSTIASKQGNLKKAIEYAQTWKSLNSSDHEAEKQTKIYEHMLAKEELECQPSRELKTTRPLEERNLGDIVYQALCRGDPEFTLEPSSLKCRYLFDHPFLSIGPIKEEQLHFNPPVWMFHDTITKEQAEYIKKSGQIKILVPDIFGRPSLDPWSNANGFFYQEAFTDKTFIYLDRLAEAITKLKFSPFVYWQVTNFGIAGHERQHYEYEIEDNPFIGNCMATIVNVIETPELGGEMVFLNHQLRIKLRKRSTLFWFNLEEHLFRDARTIHGSCPIIVGSKWLLKKSFRSFDQTFSRPCGVK